ncbi:c-type cytochrome [Burkholderiaceae bacterium DAT-1]|nr:c-type cytochrome [Burkholderiaceae bacterium DAT-1]
MKHLAALLLIATASLSLHASEKDGQAVAAKYNCMGCHSVEQRIVGPAFRDVAIRYRDQNRDEVEKDLMHKVKTGTGGNWGSMIKMPAQQIKDNDLRIIIRWVLSQK